MWYLNILNGLFNSLDPPASYSSIHSMFLMIEHYFYYDVFDDLWINWQREIKEEILLGKHKNVELATKISKQTANARKFL